MNKFSNNGSTFAKHFQRSYLYDSEPYVRSGPKGIDELQEEVELKQTLKRAVANVDAPQYLIETIRSAIRK